MLCAFCPIENLPAGEREIALDYRTRYSATGEGVDPEALQPMKVEYES